MSSVDRVTCAQVERLERNPQLDEMSDSTGQPLNWTKVVIQLQDGRSYRDFLPNAQVASLVNGIHRDRVSADVRNQFIQAQRSEESADEILTRLFKQRNACAIV